MAGGNQQNQSINIGDSSDQNLQRAHSVTESIYEYHPKKTTTITTVNKQSSPVVNFTTGNNGVQKSFETYSYTTGYKPSSGYKATFGGANLVVNGSGQGYSNDGGYNQALSSGNNSYGATYHYVSTKPQVISSYNTANTNQYNLNNNYSTQTIQTVHTPQIMAY